MAKVRLLNGKPLLINGKVALSDACCCSTTTPPITCGLPDEDCPHAVCFEVKFDSSDVSNKDMFDIGEGDMGMWKDIIGSTMQFTAYGWGNQDTITISLDADWHRITFQIYKIDDSTGGINWSVDNMAKTFTGALTLGTGTSVNFGARFGDPGAHRSFRNMSAIGNPDCGGGEDNFIFPADTFDAFFGGASVVGSELRIDDDANDAYAIDNFDPQWNMQCTGACCSNSGTVCTDGFLETTCEDLGGQFAGACTTCADDDPCSAGGECGTTASITVSGTAIISCAAHGDIFNGGDSHSFSLTSQTTNCVDDSHRSNCTVNCGGADEGSFSYGVTAFAAKWCCDPNTGLSGITAGIEFGCSYPQSDACDMGTNLESRYFIGLNINETGLLPGSHSFSDHYQDTAVAECSFPERIIDLTVGVSIS